MSPHPIQARGAEWAVALDAAARSGATVVALDELEDADRVRAVIDAVWGEQVLPRELIRAFQHAGCVLYGAESGGDLVGFVLGFLGFEGGLHLHSHMLAAVPGRQSRGIGFSLKLVQRAACLDAGIEEVRWTFDPLVARNGYFNLAKLGAVASGFLPDFYGVMTDRLNEGDRSDRFEVLWRLRSDRVEKAIHGKARPPATGPGLLRAQGDPPRPVMAGAAPAPGARVEIPRDHLELRLADADLGRRWREAASAVFEACFGAGLMATWFSPETGYVFEPAKAAR